MGVPTHQSQAESNGPAGDTDPEAQAATNGSNDTTTSAPDGTMDDTNTKGEAPEAPPKATEDQSKAPEDDSKEQSKEQSKDDSKEQSAEDDSADDSKEQSAEDDSADDLTDDDLEALDSKARRSVSKVRRENANLRSRLAAETLRADRAEIAHQANLPADAVKFLTGDTREDMEKNAADLVAMLGYGGRVTPGGLPMESAPGDGSKPLPAVTPEQELDSIGARMYSN